MRDAMRLGRHWTAEANCRYAARALFLFAVFGGLSTLHADTDWGNVVLASVNNLVDLDGMVFASLGIVLVAAAAFSKLMWAGVISPALRSASFFGNVHHHHPPFSLEVIIKTLLQAWVLVKILEGWAVFHRIPMSIADGLVASLAQSKADDFMLYVKSISTGLEQPNPLALLKVLVYVLILCDMGILALCTFLLTSFCYIGEAIFVVITPLMFWCTFFSVVFTWFWNCVQNMFSFAFYKVIGAVIIYILTDVLLRFFVTGVGTDYTLDHWMVLLPMVVMFTGLYVFSLLLVPLLAASIFNGAGAIGQAVILTGQKAASAAV